MSEMLSHTARFCERLGKLLAPPPVEVRQWDGLAVFLPRYQSKLARGIYEKEHAMSPTGQTAPPGGAYWLAPGFVNPHRRIGSDWHLRSLKAEAPVRFRRGTPGF